ncbi:MAG: Hpt domain-containing protein [Ferrovibrio sp.]|jgi:chemotaxis protein histidine kinase CheA|nr:Hpt domain-containing protein [Ferrovibrio sp.]
MSDDVEFIGNPNLIARKARPVGKNADDMLKTADQRVAALKNEFGSILKRDTQTIIELLRNAETDLAGRQRYLLDLRRVAHELRGQGGTFGYPLVTAVCDSYCKLLDMIKDVDEARLPLVRTHVDALRAVVGADIKGDGGAIGRELMESLRVIRQKVAEETGSEL